MSRPASIPIDPDRQFPHLSHAPTVEAIIHWKVTRAKALDRDELRRQLTQRFGDYLLREQQQLQTSLSATNQGVESRQRTRWSGFHLIGSNEKYNCQVKSNEIVFSRLLPYEDWNTFVAEALRFWDYFVELAAPAAVERLGVRFINQMALTNSLKFMTNAAMPTGMSTGPNPLTRTPCEAHIASSRHCLWGIRCLPSAPSPMAILLWNGIERRIGCCR